MDTFEGAGLLGDHRYKYSKLIYQQTGFHMNEYEKISIGCRNFDPVAMEIAMFSEFKMLL